MAEGHIWIRKCSPDLGKLPYSLVLINKLYSSEIINEEQLENIKHQTTGTEKNLELWRILEKKCMGSPGCFNEIMECLEYSECPDALRILNNCKSSSSQKQATSAASSNSTTKIVAPRNPNVLPPPTKSTGKVETWQDKFLREHNTKVDDKTLWSKCLEISNPNKSFDYKNQNTIMSVKCGTGKIVLKNVKEFKLNSLFQNISTTTVGKPHTLEYVTNEINNAMFQNFLSYCSMLEILNIEFPMPISISISLSKLANLKLLTVKNANLTAHTSQDICSKMENLVVFSCQLKGNNLETEFPKLFPVLKSLQIDNSQKFNKRADFISSTFLNGTVFKKLL